MSEAKSESVSQTALTSPNEYWIEGRSGFLIWARTEATQPVSLHVSCVHECAHFQVHVAGLKFEERDGVGSAHFM
jgi:hypothetical protein